MPGVVVAVRPLPVPAEPASSSISSSELEFLDDIIRIQCTTPSKEVRAHPTVVLLLLFPFEFLLHACSLCACYAMLLLFHSFFEVFVHFDCQSGPTEEIGAVLLVDTIRQLTEDTTEKDLLESLARCQGHQLSPELTQKVWCRISCVCVSRSVLWMRNLLMPWMSNLQKNWSRASVLILLVLVWLATPV